MVRGEVTQAAKCGFIACDVFKADQIYNKLFGEEALSAKRKQIENDQNVIACLRRDMRLMETRRISEGPATTKIETYRNVTAELGCVPKVTLRVF